MNELAHRRTDDDHLGLASGGQARIELVHGRVPAQRGERRKVQRLAQATRADLHQSAARAERARFADAGHQPGERGGLAHARVVFIEEFGE